MTKFRKLCLCAAAALAAVSGAVPAQAATETVNGVTWTYLPLPTGARITKAEPVSGNMAVPATLGGKTTSVILNGAFQNCTGLTGISIPGSVQNIGSNAFADCWQLESVSLGNGVRTIGDYAFHDCSLESIAFPDSLAEIGEYAFCACSLQRVSIPASVSSIGVGAFSFNPLASISVAAGNTNYMSKDGILFTKDGQDLLAYPCARGGTYQVPNSVRRVRESAFAGTEATSVVFPDTVKQLGVRTFEDARKLASVVLPSMLDELPDRVFLRCRALKSVRIPNVTNIGVCAFYQCSSLEMLDIPGRVASIGTSAFAESGVETVLIRDGVQRVGAYAFKNCNRLKELYVPKSWEGTAKLAQASVPAGCTVVYGLPNWNVTFDATGGQGTVLMRRVVYPTIGTLPTATRSGYVFLGWYTAKSGGDKITASTKITSDCTVYAQWAKPKYTVAFNANGGKGAMAKQTMTYNKAAKLRKNAFKRDGCAFRGWATSKKGDVVYKNQQSVKNLRRDGKTTTLYAKWAKKNYTVAFNANGGKGTMAKQAMTWGTAAKLRKNAFKRSGCKFIGWAKTKGGAVVYKNAAEVKNLTTGGGTVTLYAKWKKLEPTALPPETGAAAPKSAARSAVVPAAEEEAPWALVTASDRSDGSAVVDGDEATSWTPNTAEGSWLVLSFAEPRNVEDVEVVGDNLPEGTRFLLSKDADDWTEGVPGRAMYVWVVFPAAEEAPVVREIRVRGGVAAL